MRSKMSFDPQKETTVYPLQPAGAGRVECWTIRVPTPGAGWGGRCSADHQILL